MPPPDEDAFRRLSDAAIAHGCPFERALLSRCAGCSLARSTLLAERELIGCASASASERCGVYRAALREKALFALRIDAASPWPFGKEIRLQCGGLLGLRRSLSDDDGNGESEGPHEGPGAGAGAGAGASAGAGESAAGNGDRVEDADAVMREALQRYGALDALPYSRIMRSVIRYEPRRRVRR